MASVELRDIVKRFGETIAVNHVNLTIEDGEFLVLLGPSGCGKTTSLRVIAGLEQADEGQVIIDGVVVNTKRPADRDMAFCFQQYALYPHLTAYENIAFPLRTQQMNNNEVTTRVGDVSKLLHLEEIITLKPRKLSAGDQQRVALARAMVRQPKVYLMDEPLSNLDAQLRVDMRAELRRIQIENQTTTVYVTHDQVEAMAMADRIAIMEKGHLLQVASPDEVYAFPANLFVANFIGSPSMNFIPCSYLAANRSLGIKTNGEAVEYKLPSNLVQSLDSLVDGADLILGIRPEDVNIYSEPVEEGLQVRMDILEPLGSENIHRLNRGELFFLARTPPAEVYAADQPLWVTFQAEGIRLFDRKSEQAI